MRIPIIFTYKIVQVGKMYYYTIKEETHVLKIRKS